MAAALASSKRDTDRPEEDLSTPGSSPTLTTDSSAKELGSPQIITAPVNLELKYGGQMHTFAGVGPNKARPLWYSDVWSRHLAAGILACPCSSSSLRPELTFGCTVSCTGSAPPRPAAGWQHGF